MTGVPQTYPTLQPLATAAYDPNSWQSTLAGVPQTGDPNDPYGFQAALRNNPIGGLSITQDPGPAYDPNMVFRFDNGYKVNGQNAHPVYYQPGQTYVMKDMSGKVIGTASSPEEMQKLAALSNTTKGYELSQTSAPQGVDYGGMMPSKHPANFWGTFLPIAAGMALGGWGLGSLTAAPAAAGGAGGASGVGGATAGSLAAGSPWEAGIAGLTAPGGAASLASLPTFAGAAGGLGTAGGVAGGLGAAVEGTPIVVTANLGGGALTAGEIASALAVPSVTGGLAATGGASSAAPASQATAAPEVTDPVGIDVLGHTTPGLSAGEVASALAAPAVVGGLAAASGGAEGASGAAGAAEGDNTIVVNGRPTPSFTPGQVAALTALPAPVFVDPAPEIRVIGHPSPSFTPAEVDALTAAPVAGGAATAASSAPKSWTQKLSTYLAAAGLGTQLIGGLLGSKGGSGSAGTVPGGLGTLNPLFHASLPSATMPGVGDRTARVMPQQDWNTYAFRPEQSFFNNVPQNRQPGYAHGGQVDGAPRGGLSAVAGPGTGRSDDIDAKLSDGEYVIDAETVAMLGDGSTKAGADKLDQFRVNIRKHKGRNLSRGKISPNAKRPERYLAGGLA